ncbi:hypothetical protein [Kribbella amoyensis]|uniref:hypothetical protein n=1 Tax=Kribbella amoyensis TaxID=996641 RepID=UPI00119EF3AA|nr:hypothetical protein [Kribbella amoyensis]
MLPEFGQARGDEVIRAGRGSLTRRYAPGASYLVDLDLVVRPVGLPEEQPDIARFVAEQFVTEEELPPVLGGTGVRHVIVVRNDRETLR